MHCWLLGVEELHHNNRARVVQTWSYNRDVYVLKKLRNRQRINIRANPPLNILTLKKQQ